MGSGILYLIKRFVIKKSPYKKVSSIIDALGNMEKNLGKQFARSLVAQLVGTPIEMVQIP